MAVPKRRSARDILIQKGALSTEERLLLIEREVYGDGGEGIATRLARVEGQLAAIEHRLGELLAILGLVRWAVPLAVTLLAPALAALVSAVLNRVLG